MWRATPTDADRDRLAEYATYFRDAFRRADQARWFETVLAAVLAGGRNNAGAMGRRAGVPTRADAAGQAIHNFLCHSPWCERAVMATARRLGAADDGGPRVWVAHDAAFPRRGRQAVGVLPQYARSVGRKVNCQVAVVVGEVSPLGYRPLAARLYLPAGWLREASSAALAAVPPPYRGGATKAEIAVSLLAGLRREATEVPDVVAMPSLRDALGFDQGVADIGLDLRDDDGELAVANAGVEWLNTALGFNHFEGRTWRGWHHHAALVVVAANYLQWQGVGELV